MNQPTNNPTQSEKLEPCPLFGHQPQIDWATRAIGPGPYLGISGAPIAIKFYSIVCPGCCSTASFESRERAITAWNSRAPIVAPQEVLFEAKLLGFAEDARITFCEPCLRRAMANDFVVFSCALPSPSSPVPPEQKIDFSCRVCGVQCDIAPDPPARAVCPEHCEDHDYRYERNERGTYCVHCGQQAPGDWYDD